MPQISPYDFIFCSNSFTKWLESFRAQLYFMLENLEKSVANNPAQRDKDLFRITHWEQVTENGAYINNISLLNGKIFEKIVMQYLQDKHIAHSTISDDTYATTLFDVTIYPRNPHVSGLNFTVYSLRDEPFNFGFSLEIIPTIKIKRYTEDADNIAFRQAFLYLFSKYQSLVNYENAKVEAKNSFFVPHRQLVRGSNGLMCKKLSNNSHYQINSQSFSFIKDLAKTLNIFYDYIVKQNMFKGWSEQDKQEQLFFRTLCVEYNLFCANDGLLKKLSENNRDALLERMPPLSLKAANLV